MPMNEESVVSATAISAYPSTLSASVRDLIRFVGQSSITISLSASSICGTVALLLGRVPNWKLLAIAFGCTYAVYNFDRVVDGSGADARSMPTRAQALRRRLVFVRTSVVAALVGALLLAASHGA